MFNVNNALKKLDEIYDKSIIPSPVIKHIREILLAGQSDEVEEIKSLKDSQKSVKWTLNSARKNIDRIEERLARLEEHKHDNADGAINMKYPSKPIEPMATYSDHGVEIGKPEKTVTDSLSIGHLSDIGAFKQKGAKLKPVTEEKPSCAPDGWICEICGRGREMHIGHCKYADGRLAGFKKLS